MTFLTECDRCHKYVTNEPKSGGWGCILVISPKGYGSKKHNSDLCWDCALSLKDWYFSKEGARG